jgi:uridine kinase
MRVTGSSKQSKTIIVGVAGGSGSGKTFFAKDLHDKLGHDIAEIVYQDNFYIDQSKKFDVDGGSVNFDHPDSIDFPLLSECLIKLKSGLDTDIPIYDFRTHTRLPQKLKIPAKKVIIVDGILIFHPPQVRQVFDHLVFFDTPEDLRFQRRLQRDVKERGRTPEGVHAQFHKQVKPMHDQFVEPSKQHAQLIVTDDPSYEDVLVNCIKLFT